MIKTVYQNRLDKLRHLVVQHGGSSAVAEKIGTTKQYISAICPISGAPKRQIGGAMARKIESVFGLPIGYLDAEDAPKPDQDSMWVEVSCLTPTIALGAPEPAQASQAIKSARLAKALIRQSQASNFDQLAVLTVQDDAMAPTCPKGSVVLLDTSITNADASGVYVIGIGDVLFVRRIHRKLDGGYDLLGDSPAYPPESRRDMKGIVVFGRVVLVMGFTML